MDQWLLQLSGGFSLHFTDSQNSTSVTPLSNDSFFSSYLYVISLLYVFYLYVTSVFSIFTVLLVLFYEKKPWYNAHSGCALSWKIKDQGSHHCHGSMGTVFAGTGTGASWENSMQQLGIALDFSLPMNLGRWYPDTFWQIIDMYLFIPFFMKGSFQQWHSFAMVMDTEVWRIIKRKFFWLMRHICLFVIETIQLQPQISFKKLKSTFVWQ